MDDVDVEQALEHASQGALTKARTILFEYERDTKGEIALVWRIEAALRETEREAEQRGMRRAAVRYCHAKGGTFSEMQDNAHQSPLYERGDMILVWVNEGDIIEHGHAIERAAAAPTTQEN